MKLYFENSSGEERLIASPKTEDEAMKEIRNFCIKRNFKIYYYRINKFPHRYQYDVGSHSECFWLELDEE